MGNCMCGIKLCGFRKYLYSLLWKGIGNSQGEGGQYEYFLVFWYKILIVTQTDNDGATTVYICRTSAAKVYCERPNTRYEIVVCSFCVACHLDDENTRTLSAPSQIGGCKIKLSGTIMK